MRQPDRAHAHLAQAALAMRAAGEAVSRPLDGEQLAGVPVPRPVHLRGAVALAVSDLRYINLADCRAGEVAGDEDIVTQDDCRGWRLCRDASSEARTMRSTSLLRDAPMRACSSKCSSKRNSAGCTTLSVRFRCVAISTCASKGV